QIAMLEKQVDQSRRHTESMVKTNLETSYRQALQKEEALRQAFDKQRAETLTQNEAAVNYRIIQQQIETNKSLLDGLLQRSKENEVILAGDRKSTRLNSSHVKISYAVFCLKKKKKKK